ncbi:efflux RND transporter permease subunit [Vibrio sp. JPW-9-11-11]|nr:efflux RND transporter permease subunit [Vibrio sp. JPW-9-11-11]
MFCVIIIGLFSFNDLRKEAFPSQVPDSITVSVNYESGDPIQAEEGIAIKIEEALETVAGIKRITSVSDSQGSVITIEKQTSYELDVLLNDVKTEIDAINNWPLNADNPVIEKQRIQAHALWVQLYGDTDRATLQTLAEDLKSDLLSQSTISDLELKAKVNPIIAVEIDETKLQAYGLTLSNVAEAINAESSTSISASLRNEEKAVRLKVAQQAYQLEDFKTIPVLTTNDGGLIRLGDIASISDDFEEDTFTLSRYNQQNAMAIEILMGQDSDVVAVVNSAKQVVAQWQQSNQLPQGVYLETWYDKSTLITERLSLLAKNAITGIGLVFIVLALFLNIRVAFWVAASLPFVFCGSLYFMTDSYLGLTINEMTTFGFIMALGIVVDDAVVVGESIYTTRRERGDSVRSTIIGTQKVAAPTTFGVLTTVAAFLSIAMIEGKLGQVYAQFASVVTVCLLLSLVESKLILPAHLAHIDTRRRNNANVWAQIQYRADRSLEWFNQHVYTRLIKQALHFRYAVVLAFIALFVLVMGMPMTNAVRFAFFPAIAGDTVTADIRMHNDASFGQTHANLLMLEQSALEVDKELRNQFGGAKSAISSLQVLANEDKSGTITIELSPSAHFSTEDFAAHWLATSKQIEGVKKLKILSKMEVVDAFKVELTSNDEAALTQVANQLKAELQSIEGVSGIDDNLDVGEPQYRFELNEQGRALGFDAASLAQQVLLAFGGDIVQRFQRGGDEVKVRVRYPDYARQTLADVQALRVRTADGIVVPLTSVAHVYSDYQKSEITRINHQRAAYISASVDHKIIASNELVSGLQRNVVPSLQAAYPSVDIRFTGEAEQQKESTDSMQTTFVLAMFAIFALLAIPLKSYVQPLLIMVAIPFGMVGAILGHWFNDLTLSLLSLNGILALSGVVVNDSLLLVSRFNELVKDKSLSNQQAIELACTSRLRAVLLTSITTFAGLAPLLSETSMQAQFLIPAAAALGYGILFATLITLVLTPSLLMIQSDVVSLKLRMKRRLFPVKSADGCMEYNG